jgi:hypothetical protein
MPAIARYIDTRKGEKRRIKKDGKTQEVFVENPNFGQPRFGTPHARLNEVQRDANSTFVNVYAGDLADVLVDFGDDDKLASEFRKLTNEKDATTPIRVKVADLRNLLNQLAAVAA